MWLKRWDVRTPIRLEGEMLTGRLRCRPRVVARAAGVVVPDASGRRAVALGAAQRQRERAGDEAARRPARSGASFATASQPACAGRIACDDEARKQNSADLKTNFRNTVLQIWFSGTPEFTV